MTFAQRLEERQKEKGSLVCGGLDVFFDNIPESARLTKPEFGGMGPKIKHFIIENIAATRDFTCCYKLNLGFYLSDGLQGLWALREVLQDATHSIRQLAPEALTILDANFGDYRFSSAKWARFAFDVLGVDAITVHPYVGQNGIADFLKREDKGVFVLCRTPNLGSEEFQDMSVHAGGGMHEPLWQYVARRVARFWNRNDNCGLVIGARYPGALRSVRKIAGDIPILIPGVADRGDELPKVLQNGLNSRGFGLVISSSKSTLFPSSGPDFAEVAARQAKEVRDRINRIKELPEREKSE